MFVEVEVVVDAGALDVVVVVVIQGIPWSTTAPKPATNTASIAAEIPLVVAFGIARITVESSMM